MKTSFFMLRRFLFFYCLLSAPAAYSQATFHKAFSHATIYDTYEEKHVPLADGGSLLIVNVANMVFLVKTDAKGEQVWTSRTGTGLEILDAAELPDKDIIVIGKINLKVAPHEDDDVFLMCMRPDGSYKWSKAYESGDGETGSILKVFQDHLFIAGLAESYHAMPSRIFLMKLDFNGEIISQGSIFQRFIEEISGLQFYDNTVYISGTARITSNTDPILLVADMECRFTEYNSFPMAGDNSGNSIAAAPGGVVISGNNTDMGLEKQLLIYYKDYDLAPSTADLIQLGNNSGTLNTSIIASDSVYYISGRIDTYSFTDEDRALLMKLDKDFKPIWAKKYYKNEGDEGFNSVSISADGSLFACGYIFMTGKPYRQLLFCRTDSTAGEGCADTVTLSYVKKPSITILHHSFDSGFKQLSKSVDSYSLHYVPLKEVEVCDKDPGVFSVSKSEICAGECVTFGSLPAGASEYIWEFAGGTPGSFTGKFPPAVCYPQPGKYSISLRTKFGSRWDTAVRGLNVLPVPMADAGPDTILCKSVVHQLHAGGGDSYAWRPDPLLSNLHIPDPVVQPLATATFYVTVSDSGKCFSSDSVTITILHPPDTEIGYDTVLCHFEPLELDAGNPGFSYHWSTSDKTQSIFPVEEGLYTVRISNPCYSSEVSFMVTYMDCMPSYFIPSAFTPDGDGLNDFFTASGEYMTVNRIKIFNRWGQKMYEMEGKNVSWDGTYHNKKCDGGVYIYLMEIRGADGQLYYPTGTIQLLE